MVFMVVFQTKSRKIGPVLTEIVALHAVKCISVDCYQSGEMGRPKEQE